MADEKKTTEAATPMFPPNAFRQIDDALKTIIHKLGELYERRRDFARAGEVTGGGRNAKRVRLAPTDEERAMVEVAALLMGHHPQVHRYIHGLRDAFARGDEAVSNGDAPAEG